MVVVFTVIRGEVTRTLRLERDVVTLGRSEGCGIVLDDVALSRTHCQFERVGAHVYVRDLNSRNGTRVGGESVLRTRLEPGDEVLVGTTRVVYEGVDQRVSGGGLASKTLQILFGRKKKREPVRDLEEENRWLRQILQLMRPLVEELEPELVLERIIDTAIDLANAERGFLLVSRGEDLTVEVARNFWRKNVSDPDIEISRHIAERVQAERQALIVEDASEDDRFREFMSVHALKLRSVLSVPLLFRGEVKGVLYLDNRFTRGTFRESDREIISAFADLAAIALTNSGAFAAERRRSRDLEEEVQKNREDLVRVRQALEKARTEPALHYSYDRIVAKSAAMRRILVLADRVIPTALPVLLEGPAGTGKETLARVIHVQGPRGGRPFVVVSCASLPASLAEVELFGHGAGAYTGAGPARGGLLEAAEGGSVFLEGIDDLDLDAQALFLRVLATGEYRRIGDAIPRRADVRVFASARTSLKDLVDAKRFREDLYFRLKGIVLVLPCLSERPEDLPDLVATMMNEDAPHLTLTPLARKALLRRPWAGNLVELRNEIRRLATLGEGVVDVDDLGPSELEGDTDLRTAVEALERRLVTQALRMHGGNVTRASDALGLSRLGLRKKIERYSIDRPDPEAPETDVKS